MAAPRLFVVAGPNGSGKSLFSSSLTFTEFEVFDGDKHMSELSLKFPETGSEALWSHINDILFRNQKLKAIQERKNYAYETNFSSGDPMKSPREFQKAGFSIELIFMGLNSLEECFQRVSYRIQSGGHYVSPESIRFNYTMGLKNLYQFYHEFDVVTLFDNAIAEADIPRIPSEILTIKRGELLFLSSDQPAWTQPIVNELLKQ